jgi:hypothetical protein
MENVVSRELDAELMKLKVEVVRRPAEVVVPPTTHKTLRVLRLWKWRITIEVENEIRH